MDWTGGYLVDIGYTSNFYPETAPSHMAFAALSVVRSPGRSLRPERMLELGFGQGFGLALLAAANPHLACEGYDFNPEHVAHARQLIKEAGLTNLNVSEASFEEVALRGGDNNVDAIAAHGIISWVSPQAQDAIVAIVRQRLQPNGLFYLSYNCMPGWAALQPIKQFLLAVKRRNPGRSSERQLALALDLITKLKDGNAGYFAANPTAAHHLNQLLQQDRAYLAHEYLDEHWHLFQFADVVTRLAEAKLSFVCSGTLIENFDAYAVPPALRALVAATDDPVMRETLRDYSANKRFRRDIFARGTAAMTPAEHRRILSELKFTLAVPRRNVSFKFAAPTGEVTGIPEIYEHVANLLDAKIVGFDELLALPPFAGGKLGTLLDCLTLLIGSRQVVPIFPAPAVDMEPAKRFNRAIIDRIRAGRSYYNLASPVAGTGIPISDLGLLGLAALLDGRGHDAPAAAKHALALLKGCGKLPMKAGRLLQDEAEGLLFLEEQLQPILDDFVPVWRRLGVV